ncbi:MAG: helix-turn-helix domain-containing protein [Gemmatimonadota bacterium]|nr:helix-turn-helix domain-containing protein [Gemmatimonadota bacterium]
MVAIAEAPETRAVQVLDDPERVRSVLSPIRVRLLRELRKPASASGLAERLGTTRQKLGYHLRVLEKEGLVRLAEERQRRGCTERLLVRTARAVVVDPEVLGELGSEAGEVQDRFSSAYLVSVAARVIGDVATLREGARDAGKRLATATQEAEIHFESPAAMRRFVDDFAAALGTLISEYDRPNARSARPFRLITGMHPRRDREGHAEDDGENR